jgi:hypothetical protein
MHAIAKFRFEQAEDERNGAPELIQFLQEQLKIEIDYDPHGIIFITRPGELETVCLFGKMGALANKIATALGCAVEETLPRLYEFMSQLTDDPEVLAIVREGARSEHEFNANGENFETFRELLFPRSQKLNAQSGLPDIGEVRKSVIGSRWGRPELPRPSNDYTAHPSVRPIQRHFHPWNPRGLSTVPEITSRTFPLSFRTFGFDGPSQPTTLMSSTHSPKHIVAISTVSAINNASIKLS